MHKTISDHKEISSWLVSNTDPCESTQYHVISCTCLPKKWRLDKMSRTVKLKNFRLCLLILQSTRNLNGTGNSIKLPTFKSIHFICSKKLHEEQPPSQNSYTTISLKFHMRNVIKTKAT